MVLGLVVAVIVLGVVAIPIVLLVRWSRKQQDDAAARGRAFAAIGASLGGREAPGGFSVDVGGQRFWAHVTTHKGQPTGFVLSSDAISGHARDAVPMAGSYRSDPRRRVLGRPRIVLRPETGRDRLGKRIAVNREIQTGDAAFDDGVYVESSAPDEDVATVLADDRLRHGVQALLDLGYQQVVINDVGRALCATFLTARPDQQDPAALQRACEELRTIAGALPAFDAGERPARAFWQAFVAIGGAVLAGVLAIVAIIWSRPAYRPITGEASWTGALLGLGALVVLLPLLALLVRGRSVSFRVLLVSGGILLVALPALGAGLAVGLNGALDRAPASQRETVVIRKRSYTGKNSTTYALVLSAWRPGEEAVELPVGYDLYRSVKEGDGVVVTTGPGRFGWEWRRAIARPPASRR